MIKVAIVQKTWRNVNIIIIIITILPVIVTHAEDQQQNSCKVHARADMLVNRFLCRQNVNVCKVVLETAHATRVFFIAVFFPLFFAPHQSYICI